MGLFSLEHRPPAYWADHAWHGAVAMALGVALGAGLADVPGTAHWLALLALLPVLVLVPLGVLLWTLAEYLLHRLVLHGLPPFSRWHALHHQRPRALIGVPPLLSTALTAALVFAPAWALLGLQHAEALTLGMVLGYLAYGLIHHAAHHGGGGRWMRQRRIWHAQHHHGAAPACYGVSTGLWDRVFATGPVPRPAPRRNTRTGTASPHHPAAPHTPGPPATGADRTGA